ncbi:hypothetical protein D3C86_1701380 [compost metagenome]
MTRRIAALSPLRTISMTGCSITSTISLMRSNSRVALARDASILPLGSIASAVWRRRAMSDCPAMGASRMIRVISASTGRTSGRPIIRTPRLNRICSRLACWPTVPGRPDWCSWNNWNNWNKTRQSSAAPPLRARAPAAMRRALMSAPRVMPKAISVPPRLAPSRKAAAISMGITPVVPKVMMTSTLATEE